MPPFRITVGNERLGFSAAHFIAYEGGGCEPLHGHNYRLRARLAGPLNEAGYVVDFVAVERMLAGIVAALDHRVLLPARSSTIQVREAEASVTVRCGAAEYAFPRDAVCLLPLENTTAELLARYLADALADALAERFGDAGHRLTIEMHIEESPGFRARYRRDPGREEASRVERPPRNARTRGP